MLKRCAFKPFPCLSFECFVNIFPCLLKLNLTQRHGGNGGFIKRYVVYRAVLMQNRGGEECLIHFSI